MRPRKKSFIEENNLILSTEGRYLRTAQRIIDTSLAGYEYVLVQRLLSQSLKIPAPITGANEFNYGLTVTILGEIYQIFINSTWNDRIRQQTALLPEDIILDISEKISHIEANNTLRKAYFPLYNLPTDACFVIRHSELGKLINIPTKSLAVKPRISTPLSRLFWLACYHNEDIRPLLRQPYKLLSIFEQWASDDGITDRLSGDTLKTALERGSPVSPSSKIA